MEWTKFGSAYVFTDAPVALRVTDVRKDYGVLYGDIAAFVGDYESGRLLSRLKVSLADGMGIRRLASDLLDRHDGYDWRSLLEYVCAVMVEKFEPAKPVGEPVVDVLAHDHIVTRIPTARKGGTAVFDFAGLTKQAGELTCDQLEITEIGEKANPDSYQLRINLLSQSSRENLVRALNGHFGKEPVNWTSTVAAAFSRAQRAFLDQDRGIQIGSLPDPPSSEAPYMLEPIVPEGQDIILFGDGSSGKTTLAYGMLLALAMGPDGGGKTAFCGFRGQWAPSLIIDYETRGTDAKTYLRRLLEGYGIDAALLEELPIYFWPAEGVPLADQIDALRRFIAKYEIRVVLIDAGADACGGEPERAISALNYFNALVKLDVTTITISHITHPDSPEATMRPFGSRYWHNRARRTWFVKRLQEDESDDIDIALFCRKVNYGRRPRPLAFRLHYDGQMGPITIERQEISDVPEFEEERSIPDRIYAYLIKEGVPLTIKDIAEGINVGADKVSTSLYRGKNKRFVQVTAPNQAHRWAVMAYGGEE